MPKCAIIHFEVGFEDYEKLRRLAVDIYLFKPKAIGEGGLGGYNTALTPSSGPVQQSAWYT